ncbi:MAG: D-Ala-D-Ala carboxypeptidase family metallohydrolase [Pseudomonadota bacterium]
MHLLSAVNPQLTAHMDLATLCYSETAERLGIPNLPHNPSVIDNLRAVAEHVIEPIMGELNLAVTVTSGYRSPALNAAIGGAAASQHLTGQAVDLIVGGVTHDLICDWISRTLDFDELILEKFDPAKAEFGWVHCSYAAGANRRKVRTFDGRDYHDGLVFVGVRDDCLSPKIRSRPSLTPLKRPG